MFSDILYVQYFTATLVGAISHVFSSSRGHGQPLSAHTDVARSTTMPKLSGWNAWSVISLIRGIVVLGEGRLKLPRREIFADNEVPEGREALAMVGCSPS